MSKSAKFEPDLLGINLSDTKVLKMKIRKVATDKQRENP